AQGLQPEAAGPAQPDRRAGPGGRRLQVDLREVDRPDAGRGLTVAVAEQVAPRRGMSRRRRRRIVLGVQYAVFVVVVVALGSAALALGLISAAYMAETIRAGIQAVPSGQLEAARSLGMSYGRAMVSIVIPQAFRIVIPPLTNELVLLVKDSSLALFIGISLE